MEMSDARVDNRSGAESARSAAEHEPHIVASELDSFFRELRREVVELEQAYQQHDLAKRLDVDEFECRFGTALCRCYQRLLNKPPRPDPHGKRRETVYALLDQLRDQLFLIEKWFHAEVEVLDSNAGPDDQSDAVRRYHVNQNVQEPVSMRFDQVVEARNWGIGFVFDDDRETDQLLDRMVRNSVRQLARDLTDLTKLMPRLLEAQPGTYPPLVAPRSGRMLEQLIADILNEHERHARLSRLAEDYSQKTDLRVKYEGLARRRGARLQVTWSESEVNHEKKVDGIRRPEQLIILSPWSLACALPQLVGGAADGEQAQFDKELIARFWKSIPEQPSTSEALARQLRLIFNEAVHTPIGDPRGPLALVPAPVREFIRIWVKFDAFRSTRALRQWEASEGNYRTGGDGRMRVHRLRPEIAQFLKDNPPGSVVEGRVTATTDKYATVELEDGLVGQLRQSELSWVSLRAKMDGLVALDQRLQLVVCKPAASGGKSVIELSLKRMRPDPWREENLQGIKPAMVLQGRVRDHVAFGIFVELKPDLVGLIHNSRLGSDLLRCVPLAFPVGLKIPVRIVSLDAKARKIQLALPNHVADP